MNKLKHIPLSRIVRHLQENEEDFLKELSEELLLGEILCGGDSPCDFW